MAASGRASRAEAGEPGAEAIAFRPRDGRASAGVPLLLRGAERRGAGRNGAGRRAVAG
ncbi:hypothetical protein Kpho02_53440 [Kitasatospora phosalacinea]|uniref:Uncharacterized protein n=1 Tax=Kitasatospora phosalacinea TaxID=2065 RepID=A0A9W6QAT5_9ACTN|nr:hypothetical protein Kpho02_53440 [Kitasatospora phosalacinea]